jgi:hypothetical protein
MTLESSGHLEAAHLQLRTSGRQSGHDDNLHKRSSIQQNTRGIDRWNHPHQITLGIRGNNNL